MDSKIILKALPSRSVGVPPPLLEPRAETLPRSGSRNGFRWLSGEPWHTALEIFTNFRHFPISDIRSPVSAFPFFSHSRPSSVIRGHLRTSASCSAREISLCVASLLRYAPVALLGYTVDSFAPARLIRRFPNLLLLRSCLWQSISTFPRSRFALRANLRLVYLAPALALDCLSLWTCAIARVFAPARLIRRFPNLLLRLRALCELRG